MDNACSPESTTSKSLASRPGTCSAFIIMAAAVAEAVLSAFPWSFHSKTHIGCTPSEHDVVVG